MLQQQELGGSEEGAWGMGFIEEHQNLLASSLNATSLYLPGMISWSNPTW